MTDFKITCVWVCVWVCVCGVWCVCVCVCVCVFVWGRLQTQNLAVNVWVHTIAYMLMVKEGKIFGSLRIGLLNLW